MPAFETRRDALRKALLVRLLRAALVLSRRACPSWVLRESMRLAVQSSRRGFLEVPHYWAYYYHEGNRGVPKGTFVVFYKNKHDDPRTDRSLNYPVRRSDVRKLSHEEFVRDRKAGLLVATVRGTKGFPGVPFFDRGMRQFDPVGAEVVQRTLDEYLTEGYPRVVSVARAVL